jgi:hypothetical protein
MIGLTVLGEGVEREVREVEGGEGVEGKEEGCRAC